jgi:4-diphosphocytidyl-2-C-methyl-D-erythritol kinase
MARMGAKDPAGLFGRTSLVAAAYAKVNLGLRVLGIRSDGRHEVDSILQAVSLHDLLEVAPADASSLEVFGHGVPAGEDNLVLRAARALEAAAGRPLPARFRLWKRIPPGSGLGGGSSDAAAALRALTRLHGIRCDRHETAARVGADVAVFLHGGRARATGAGDVLQPLEDAPAWFALAWPAIEVSTAEVYRRWDTVGGGPPNELRLAAELVHPPLARFALSLGPGWQMSGSGAAFFKPCATEEEARRCIAQVPGWTAVASAVARWA